MKLKTVITILLLVFVAASVVFLVVREAGKAAAAGPNVADDAKTPVHQVLAYYFRTNVRCPSCVKIEKYTTRAVTEGFADELNSGALVFRVVNTDEKGNEHFTKDYALVTKSVVLADLHKGQQTRWVNLEQVWDLLGDEQAFVKYVQAGVRDYLDEKK